MLALGTGRQGIAWPETVFGAFRAPVHDADGKDHPAPGGPSEEGAFLFGQELLKPLCLLLRCSQQQQWLVTPFPAGEPGDSPRSGICALRSPSGLKAFADQAWGRGAQSAGHRENLVPSAWGDVRITHGRQKCAQTGSLQ